MNSAEAQRILMAHREGHASAADPEVLAALEQARQDPALGEWWKQQSAFHAAMAKGFASIPVPEKLREQIGLRCKVVAPPWWQTPRLWAAAAAVLFMIGLAALFWPRGTPVDSFPTFRSRMVSSVLRQYRMDIQTNNMAAIRDYLKTRQAPSDYTVPPGSRQLAPSGAGVLTWQASPVSMVCLDSGGQGTVFLFVARRGDLRHSPGTTPEFVQVNKLMTASWADGERVYLLAFQGGVEALRKFL